MMITYSYTNCFEHIPTFSFVLSTLFLSHFLKIVILSSYDICEMLPIMKINIILVQQKSCVNKLHSVHVSSHLFTVRQLQQTKMLPKRKLRRRMRWKPRETKKEPHLSQNLGEEQKSWPISSTTAKELHRLTITLIGWVGGGAVDTSNTFSFYLMLDFSLIFSVH